MALLALNLVFGTFLSSAFAAVPQDAQKHWASTTLQKWVESGLIKGYKDGSVKPDAPIKRSEFVALLNRALKLSNAQNNLTFSDLPTTHWAFDDFAIAVKAGYLQGTGGKAYPNRLTTRQEAAVMIAKAFKLDSAVVADASVFKDADQIASWSREAITALAAKKVLTADAEGNMRPQASITRAEAVVAIDAALALKPAATEKVIDPAKDDIKVSTPTGGGGGGGSGTGTNPGTGTEYCTGNAANTVDCDNSKLSTISVTSSVYDQIQLVQRDGSKNIVGTSFNSDALYYSVGVPRSFVESDIAVSVTAATYAKTSYSLAQNDGTYRSGLLQNGQNTINVHLKPLEDAHLYIFVTSGNGKNVKVYEIQFVYDRDIQEAFYLQNNIFYGGASPYQLVSNSLENGDVVTVKIPASNHLSQQETVVTGTVDYGQGLVLLTGFGPTLPQGNLYVTVARDGQLIMDGEYAYDLTLAQVVTNGDGIEISLWTNAELTSHDQQGNTMHQSNYGYKVRFNAQAIAANPQLANVKYVSFKWHGIYIIQNPPATILWTKEATKFSWNRFWAVHELKRIDQFENSPYTFVSSDPTEEVRNQFMYVFAFDANKQLIGYYVHTVNFDADHLGSHVTLIPPIQPPLLP